MAISYNETAYPKFRMVVRNLGERSASRVCVVVRRKRATKLEGCMDKRLLHLCKVEYLLEQPDFSGHIKHVDYWYRKIFNNRRGKSATERYNERKVKS